MDRAEAGVLGAIIFFYAMYFVKQRLLRAQGISASRLMRGEKPRRTWAVETLLTIATFGMGAAQCLSLVLWRRLPLPLPEAARAIGPFVAYGGGIVFALSMLWMGPNWRAGIDQTQDTRLVTGGIYRFSRNPAFVGFDLFYLGTALALPCLPTLAGAALAAAALHLQILEEERYLDQKFGEAYRAYRAKTRRYF